jgi:hypothetical protein
MFGAMLSGSLILKGNFGFGLWFCFIETLVFWYLVLFHRTFGVSLRPNFKIFKAFGSGDFPRIWSPV